MEFSLAGAVVIGILIALALFSAGRESIRPIKPPEDIDLTSVRNAMVEKHGWSLDRAWEAQAEYVRFLTLLQKKPNFMLVPWLDPQGRDDLDQFWHQHILDTAKYAADCQALFGKMIHHNPHLARGSAEESEAVTKTQRLYARTFQSGPYGAEADAVVLSGCSACGSDSSDSHSSHSGHDGDSGSGHSDGGGHGCGGHGCGHGCGSGCGGH